MPVSYNNKKIIPAPQMTVAKEYQRVGDGAIVGKMYKISLKGSLISDMGSPNSTGVFWETSGYPTNEDIPAGERLASIQRKQDALMKLFSEDGKSLDVQTPDGTKQSFKCNPRCTNIDFTEGLWIDRCEYTISLEVDEILPATDDSFTEYISDANEAWSIETNEDEPEALTEPRTYKITHIISAVGKRHFDGTGALVKEAWQQAKAYVTPKLGLDNTIALAPDVLNLPSYYTGYNHIRTQQVDERAGSFEVTENWVFCSGTAIEEFNVDVAKTLDNPYTKVTLQGNIRGLEQRDANLNLIKNKYDNAYLKYTWVSGQALSRAQQYSNLVLNTLPTSETFGTNALAGTITYNYEYDTRPVMINGARSTVVSVNDTLAGKSYAAIFVLGRTNGPVLQDLKTSPEKKRSLSIEIVMYPTVVDFSTQSSVTSALNNNPRLSSVASTQINNIINGANPTNGGYTLALEQSPQENWEPLTGRYTYNIEWIYE